MAKTYQTNPHSEEPPRRSNRTAGKSPASVDLPARKPATARKTTAAHKDTAAREDTAASPSGNSNKFIGERKGPPEVIVPAPEAVTVTRLPTLWEWTPPSGVGGERKGPPEAIVPGPEEPEDTMPSMVAHDFAADRDVAAAPRRTSRRYPMMAGEEGKHDGGEHYDDGYDSVESVDDDRDGDFVPKGFEYSDDDDDFDHLLDDDNIDDEEKRIEKAGHHVELSFTTRKETIVYACVLIGLQGANQGVRRRVSASNRD